MGAGTKRSSTSRHAIAPICPMAPIVCRNFINRRSVSWSMTADGFLSFYRPIAFS